MIFKIKPENGKKQFEIHISRAKENLGGAKILVREEHYRDAVSRAYYSIFEAAHAALITKGLAAKTHAGVIQLFSLHFIKTKEIPGRLSGIFNEARKAREEADYQFLRKFSKEEAERIIESAEEFIKIIEEKLK